MSALLARLRITRADVATAFVLGVSALLAYVATVRVKPLFAPDTRYYAAMTLHYTGSSKEAAAAEVAARTAELGFNTPGPDQLFGWGLVQPRVVYPGLSTPFTAIFGIDGLLVVPAIATALFIAVAAVLLSRRFGRGAAIATLLLVCTSSQIFYYFGAMLTESLSALWTALLLGVVWRYQRSTDPTVRRRLVVAMAVLMTVSAFTRQATLIPAGAFVAAWFFALVLRGDHRAWRVPAAVTAVCCIGWQVVQTLVFPTFSQLNQFKLKTGADTLGEALAAAPGLAKDILVADVRNMVYADRPLLLLLVLAVVSMIVLWRRPESHLLLGSLVAYEIYNVTNGTPTVFRYGTPGLIFVLASVAMLVAAGAATLRAADADSADRADRADEADEAAGTDDSPGRSATTDEVPA